MRTGIGHAVDEILRTLRALADPPEQIPYTLSIEARRRRNEVPASTRFVPIPARVLLSTWTRSDLPRVDRWLHPARVLHATNYLCPPSGLPTLVSVYDCSFVRYPELCAPEVRVFEPILRRAIRRGVTVHTTSEFVANEIDEIFGPNLRASGRLVVVRLGIPALGDASEMPRAVTQRVGAAPYVLAIGTLEPRKNLAHLVSAFGALAATDPDLHLVIAGNDGPARPNIDAAIARLPASAGERIVLPGPVSEAGRRALLEGATVLAYPSIYEGFGLPVLEAMSVGVPVVTARAGAIPEVAGDAALLVEPTDEAGLAAAIKRLREDDATRRDLIERGRRRVLQFSWDDTARAGRVLHPSRGASVTRQRRP